MSDYAIMPLEDLQAACDAIRTKTGTSDLIKSGDMAGMIEGIEGSGNAETCIVTIPESAYGGEYFYYVNSQNEYVKEMVSHGNGYDGVTMHELQVLKYSTVIINMADDALRNGWGAYDIGNGGYYFKTKTTVFNVGTGRPIAFFVDHDIEFGYNESENEPT